MSRIKIISAIAISILLFVVAMLNNAVAGEKHKIKAHGVSHTVKSEQIIVGDVEGHILVIAESRGVGINEISGEKMVSRAVTFADVNPALRSVFVQGYMVETDKDGDKMIHKLEGKAVAKGQSKGTWTTIKGTGKYEGGKGGGTWTTYDMGNGMRYSEVEGEAEAP